MSVGSQPDYHCFIDRVNDVKVGNLIGVDKYGNKYYEDKKHFFFGESPDEHDFKLQVFRRILLRMFRCVCYFISVLCKQTNTQRILHHLWFGNLTVFSVKKNVFSTSPLGDLHHGDERKEHHVGGGRQHGSSWMVRPATSLQN